MGRPETDSKFVHACERLTQVAPEDTVQAVSNINQLIVDHLVREHPQASHGDRVDFDILRTLWKHHERLDPID